VEALTKQILMIDHGRIVAHGGLHEVRRTLHDRPHAIRVRVDCPRRLAAQLAGMEVVAGLRVPAANTLMIETTSPEQVYERLPELILAENMKVSEIATADESLEAVFGYLTQRSG
jgi:ABC-2 type transport system ATP-binding protein